MALPIWQRTITTASGDLVPNAEITVVNEATGLGATIFSNREGTTPLGTGGVFFTGSDGFAQFYAAPGEYRVTAEGVSGSQTWRWIALVGDAAFLTSAVESTADTAVLRDENGNSKFADATEDQHPVTLAQLGALQGQLTSVQSVTGNATVSTAPFYGHSLMIVDAATAEINLPPLGNTGALATVLKANATQGAVNINADGTDTITRADLDFVTVNADGDNWTFRDIGSRWELVSGWESGSNANGNYLRDSSGKQFSATSQTYSLTYAWTFPAPYSSAPYGLSATLTTGTALNDTAGFAADKTATSVTARKLEDIGKGVALTATGDWY